MPSYTIYSETSDWGWTHTSGGWTSAIAGDNVFTVQASAGTTFTAGASLLSGTYSVRQEYLDFNTSAVVGTPSAASFNFTVSTLNGTGASVLEARKHPFLAGDTNQAQFVAGSDLASKTLIGSVAATSTGLKSISFANPADIDVASSFGVILFDERQRTAVAPSGNNSSVIHSANATGTTNDPYLAITTVVSVALTASTLGSGTPTLGTPSLTQLQGLQSTGLASGVPALGTPTIGIAHALQATGLVGGAPSLDGPSIGQKQVITATGLAIAAPTLDVPSFTQRHSFVASGLSTAPTIGLPGIAAVYRLTVGELAVTPLLGAASFGQIHFLTAANLTVAPVLASPVITRIVVAFAPASRRVELVHVGSNRAELLHGAANRVELTFSGSNRVELS